MKEDIKCMIHEIYNNQKTERKFNANFCVSHPQEIRCFWIEGLQTTYKSSLIHIRSVRKDTAERLKKVVDKLVNKHQMAFIKWRQIMDATLIASECVDSRLKGVESGIMCKLDIKKAYDHVIGSSCWTPSDKWALEKIGWVGFIFHQHRSSFFLVNGELVGFFPLERGLRQGDPLSPFLFILAIEGFDSLMRIAIQNRWIKGFQIKGSTGQVKGIYHLLYADDTIVSYEPREEK